MYLYIKITIVILCTIACKVSASNDSLLIKLNPYFSDCNDYFIISKEIETDPEYSSILNSYLYKSLVGALDCEIQRENLDSLSKRKSFVKTVLLFYKNKDYLKLNHYENVSRWVECYDNLLYNCNNTDVLYDLTDTLLYFKKSNGIIVLWDKLDINRLKNIDSYLNYIVKNNCIYKIAELIIVFHNNKEFEKRDYYLKKIKKFQDFKKQSVKLLNLIEEYSFINYEQYIEEIYGGY